MIRFFLISSMGLVPGISAAQCLSGDCTNGTGKYDFGYAVYEGSFKNGKPHGKGTLDYGGGEKYVGGFVDGQEEGEGILYKGGKQSAVTYRAGQLMVRKMKPIAIGGNKISFDGGMDCTGDCYNGEGTAKFPSGNVYTGGFRNGLFHGKGRMRFASGNVLEGDFADHVPLRGTFTYASDGTVFYGTFHSDGTPASGTYKSRETGGVVAVSNGVITGVSNPRADSLRAAQPAYSAKKCSVCKGAGFTTGTSTSYQQLTPNVYRSHSSGVADLVSSGQSVKHTRTVQIKCYACGGSGSVQERQKRQ